jgi:hypothetical protein
VIGPLIIVFDVLAAKEAFIPELKEEETEPSTSKFGQQAEGKGKELMSEEEKRVKESAKYLLDWRYIGRCVKEGKWNSSGNLLWLKDDGIYWDATKRPLPNDPTTALPDTVNKASKLRESVLKYQQEVGVESTETANESILRDESKLSQGDEPFSPLVEVDEEEEEMSREEMRKATSGSVRIVVNKFVQVAFSLSLVLISPYKYLLLLSFLFLLKWSFNLCLRILMFDRISFSIYMLRFFF